MAINFDSISRGGVKSCHLFLDNFLLEINKNQPKIAKSWGGLWRLGGGYGWKLPPAKQHGSELELPFFNQREPRKKRVMGCRKSGMRKNPQGILENLVF